LVADLSEAEFIDSTILRALAYAPREAAGHDRRELAIGAPHGCVARRLLTLTGIDRTIPTYETRAQAVAALTRGS
jgi:anti-anti-sigma regulatory factor